MRAGFYRQQRGGNLCALLLGLCLLTCDFSFRGCKDGANRMQSSSLELLRCSPFSQIACKGTTFSQSCNLYKPNI